jgi:SAM-dependent methyltransferase
LLKGNIMNKSNEAIREKVRGSYAKIALTDTSCCGPSPDSTGYDPAELAVLPEEAIMGLGCGNPVALAGIAEGETVLDLGSGGGIDVFLAARKTGDAGRVIGVDMTPEMLERAEANAAKLGFDNVEFRPGLIEDLPVGDATVDVVISNCVINLAPDKRAVFAEVARVLRNGGRLIVSDIVTDGPLPDAIVNDPEAWAACVGGALPRTDYVDAIRAAGLVDVEVLAETGSGPTFSITVRARKP